MPTPAELSDIYSHFSQSFVVSSLATLLIWITCVIPIRVVFRRRWDEWIGTAGDVIIFLLLSSASIFFSLLAHCMRDYGVLELSVRLLQFYKGY